MFFKIISLTLTVSALDNGVGLLPPLGWSTWNRFGFAINETLIHEVADALLATGLARAGFVHVNVVRFRREPPLRTKNPAPKKQTLTVTLHPLNPTKTGPGDV